MGSYELHAWRDAMAIAALLDETIGAAVARSTYDRVAEAKVRAYEQHQGEEIAAFIQKSESQRPAVIRRLPDDVTRVTFMTLAILGCVRAKDVMEIRDSYRNSLAPGGGNRVTTAEMYRFAEELRGVFDYQWPGEVFDAMGLSDDDGSYDDDEQDEEVEGAGQPAGSANAQDLEPKLPPPPAAPTPPAEQRYEIVVVLAKSSKLQVWDEGDGKQRLRPRGAAAGEPPKGVPKELWSLMAIDPVGGRLLFKPYAGKPNLDADLVEMLKTLVGVNWSSTKTVLVLAGGMRTALDELNRSAGEVVAAEAASGVSQRAFTGWVDGFLCDLATSLEVIGLKPPTVDEVGKATPTVKNWCYVHNANIKDDWSGYQG